MVEKNKIYKCSICGNVISIVDAKNTPISCCGEEMSELPVFYSENEGREKHVPLIEKIDGGVKVEVGSVHHPMDEDHYIGLIELLSGGVVVKSRFLKPGDNPMVRFVCKKDFESLSARAWCNKHGLWRS